MFVIYMGSPGLKSRSLNGWMEIIRMTESLGHLISVLLSSLITLLPMKGSEVFEKVI